MCSLASDLMLLPYASSATMRPMAAPVIDAERLARPGDEGARLVRVAFVTPTLLRDAGENVTVPSFGPLVRRLRVRLGALATFFGAGELGDDAKELAAGADRVELRSTDTRWQHEQRHSTRTGQRHPLAGMIGEAVYAGELGRFLPMLRLGELLHVGKHASFGLGRIEVSVLG